MISYPQHKTSVSDRWQIAYQLKSLNVLGEVREGPSQSPVKSADTIAIAVHTRSEYCPKTLILVNQCSERSTRPHNRHRHRAAGCKDYRPTVLPRFFSAQEWPRQRRAD